MQLSRFVMSVGVLMFLATSVAVGQPAHGAVVGLHARKIAIGQQNNSGQTGHASLKQVRNDTQVTLTVGHAPKTAEPAHIHKGTCANLDPTPAFPLNDVKDGKSVSTVHNFTFAMIKKAHYAINVHKSAANLKAYVACGDL